MLGEEGLQFYITLSDLAEIMTFEQNLDSGDRVLAMQLPERWAIQAEGRSIVQDTRACPQHTQETGRRYMCDWSAMSAEKVRTEVRGAQIKWGFVGCGEHFVSYSEMEDITSFGQGRG